MRQIKPRRLLLTAASALPALAMAQQTERPNIMLIVVDDMGYSDLQCFGGEVESPNLNSLAANGIRFTQFFNSGRSCPSRAQLLTGRYAQTVGITGMGQSLTHDCVTIPEVLRTAGYHTAMSGKWHLSLTKSIGTREQQMQWLSHQNTFDNAPFAPLDTYPCNRGFDEHWGTIWGVVDHYDPFSLVHNETPIYTDAIPDDFYSSDFITQKAIDMLDGLDKKNEPFFMYVSYNAPHWPLHAKPQDIAKYKGKFDDGWDAMRTRRYNNLVKLGLLDPEETPVATNASGRAWENEPDKAFQAANMEVHAAMVDCVDQGIGRIIQKMKADGVFDNTIIIFTSDNGASSENYSIGDFDRHDRTRSGEKVIHDSRTPGDQLSYNYLHTGWAGAVNTPFRYWKTTQFHGGTAAPTIIHWPKGIAKDRQGTINREPCQFLDIMPTCIELADATYPTTYDGHAIKPLCAEGRSLTPLLSGDGKWDSERTMYWEHENGRAIRKGDWRLTALSGAGWQLFDMKHDYSETNNLAAEHPDKVRELKTLWNSWAKSVGLTVPQDIADTDKEVVFHYSFDDNLDDQSHNAYTLTPSAKGYSYAEGVHGKALALNGDGQYLDFNHPGLFNPSTTQTTFCAWVYADRDDDPTAATGTEGGMYYRDEIILAQKDNGGTGRLMLYARAEKPRTGDGDTRFFYSNFLGGTQNHASYGSLTPGKWQHVAVVCNPVDLSVTYYINGKRDCTVAAKSFESCVGGLRIGAHKAGISFFRGRIDDAYFFRGALTPDEIKKVMDGTIDLADYTRHPDPSDTEWPLDGKAYTVRNFSTNAPAYMQDNLSADDRIQCGGTVTDNSYWAFEKTANAHCYYVRNTATGRYIQGYRPTAQTVVTMGTDKAEYHVAQATAENGNYGFAYTGNTPHDFTSGTIGLNLRGESTEAGSLVQTFASAAGVNHRSFWLLDKVADIPTAIVGTRADDALPKRVYDLQGRRLSGMPQRGVYIVDGQKVIR